MSEVATLADVPHLFKLMEKERSPHQKSQIIDILTRLGDPRLKDYLTPLLEDPDLHIRMSLYRYMGTVLPQESGDLLAAGMNDKNPKIRGLCADILLKLGDLRALKTLSSLLNEQDKLQRVQNVLTLREMANLALPSNR